MGKKLILLIGERIDIEDLIYSLRVSQWSIIKESDGYYLTCELLNKIDDIKEVESKAKQFLDILNGAANLFHGNHRTVGMGSIVQINEEGQRNVTLQVDSISIRSRVRGDISLVGSTIEKPTTIEIWIEKSDRYESIRDVLYFFKEITWWNLFKIFEIIRDDLGGKKNLFKYIDKGRLNHFTQAAQSRELLGDNARHASKRYIPPTKKISLNEAYEIIKDLFNNWINTK
jgi:hypothetical protein